MAGEAAASQSASHANVAISSKPDRGIVTIRLSLVRDDDEVVMSHLDTILVRRRVPLG
jgi:hypothetical protein